MAGKLRVGVIGLGVGLAHARGFGRNEQCDLTMVCDLSEARLAEAAKIFPRAAATTDERDILTNPDIDIVVVASYDDCHHRQILSALEHGKHVFAEKPLTLHVGEAREIRRMLERTGLRMTSNLCLRTCPLFIAVRNAVRSGAMGPVFSLEGDYLWGRKHKVMEGWRTEMDFYSIILGAGVHMIDLLIWVTGQRVAEVHAFGNDIATRGGRLRHNDFASVNLRFEDGAVGRVAASGGCVHPHFHRLAVFGRDKTFLHTPSRTEWLESGEEGPVSVSCPEAYPGREERVRVIAGFVDEILGDAGSGVVDENAAFDTMSVCFAAQKSMEIGQPIMVEYI
jgi:predicted dehydrogenase